MTNFLLRRFVPDYQNTADPAVREKYGNLAGIVGIICNVLLFAGKLLAGTLCGSVSVTADAVNNLSDASSSLVTLLGFRLAARPADEKHPYGHARMEYLSGLAVAVMILVIGVELVKSSVQKILHPEAVEFSVLTAAVLTGSILLKLWMALFDRKLGRKISSAALIAAAADSRSDVIATGAVLLACVVGRLTGLMIDGWAGLLVALFILWSGVGVVKDTVDPLLGAKRLGKAGAALSEEAKAGLVQELQLFERFGRLTEDEVLGLYAADVQVVTPEMERALQAEEAAPETTIMPRPSSCSVAMTSRRLSPSATTYFGVFAPPRPSLS